MAVAGGERQAALLRDLLARTGRGEWRVLPLSRAAGPLAVASLGELDWPGLGRAVREDRIALAVLDLDAPLSRYWLEAGLTPCLTYSENKDQADLTAKNLVPLSGGGVRFEALWRDALCRVTLAPGSCSLYQALEVMACARAAGVEPAQSAAYLSALPAGRPVTICG